MEVLWDINPLFIIGLLGAGAIAGVLAGLMGVGGGIVIVPALFGMLSVLQYPESIIMHVAVGTSLLTIIPTALSSMYAHNKKEGVDWELFKAWLPAMGLAALLGGIFARYVDGSVLTWLFACVALYAAYSMLNPHKQVLYPHLPSSMPVQYSMAASIGFLSSWMGIGGGSLSVPLLSLCNYPVHRAVGTSSSFGLVIALPATLGFMWAGAGVEGRPALSIGYVNILSGLVIVSMSILFAPIGAGLAHRLNARRLKQIFALFLIVMALRMIVSQM